MRGTKEVVCHPEIAVNSTYASSAVSATIDWMFGLLPIWIIENLQINRRRKIALGAIMGLGAVYVSDYLQPTISLTSISASVAPIVRIPYTISLAHSDDFLCKQDIQLHGRYLTADQGPQSTHQFGVPWNLALALLPSLLRRCAP